MSAPQNHRRAFTLIETLVGLTVFLIVSVTAYQAFTAAMRAANLAKIHVDAAALANEQFEIARNLTYGEVGIVGGLPAGLIPASQTLTRDGHDFTVGATVRNIDDPFDGTIGGTPNDLSPADYKLVVFHVSCTSCMGFSSTNFTGYVGPQGLETTSTNGALFIKVFDASGQPVVGANVHIEDPTASPSITIDDTTDNAGMLEVVDAPPDVQAYQVSVSKSGYSSDRTYTPGDAGNPNPSKPDATVVTQNVTQTSFSIDKTSTLNFSSVSDTCSAIPSYDFSLTGSKIIGTSPDVKKYSASKQTGGSGSLGVSGLEWDTYDLTPTDTTYDLAGSIPLTPITVNPGTTQSAKLVLQAKDPDSLLVTVVDAATGLPISGADVELANTSGYDSTETTGRGFLNQTDWSGGSGQADYVDPTQYESSDFNVETLTTPGQVTLKDIFGDGNYAPSGTLTSSAFDTGSASDFHQILWLPLSQPPDTGADSVRFQIATNNDDATWNFLGPDGTDSTYYTTTSQDINAIHNGHRYFKYKMFLSTTDTTWTPTVSDVSFTFTSACVPPGQVFFHGLAADDYDLTITASGYQVAHDTVTVGSGWQQHTVTMSP